MNGLGLCFVSGLFCYCVSVLVFKCYGVPMLMKSGKVTFLSTKFLDFF